MRILVVNTGSSSLKLRLLGQDDEVVATCDVDPWDGEHDVDHVASFLHGLDVEAVGHRVVHGGVDLCRPALVDDQTLARMEALVPLAPLHQPRSLAGLRAVRALLPATPSVACFDTAFHATLPPAAATYALPSEWRGRWPLRRFGFHGLSHAHAVRRAAELSGWPADGLRVVSCHLGAGASLCAAVGGRSVDTTMGFTPLDGLVMATRSGAVDPGLVLWLVQQGGLAVDEVAEGLRSRSGLAGLTEGSGDMRSVVAAAELGVAESVLALEVYLHRLRAAIAAMAASLGGVDVLVFTGGVGEHQPAVRAGAAEGLGFLGVAVDAERNAAARADADVSADDSRVRTLVVTSREDVEIARGVREVLG